MSYDIWDAQLVIPTEVEPNWTAVEDAIDSATIGDLQRSTNWTFWTGIPDMDTDAPMDQAAAPSEAAKAYLRSCLTDVRAAYENPIKANALFFEVRGHHVFIIGGGTSGGPPHPLWDSLLTVADNGLLFAAGFTQLLGMSEAELEAADER